MLKGLPSIIQNKPGSVGAVTRRSRASSRATTAAVVRSHLAARGLARRAGGGDVHFLATDGAERFRQVGEHFFGEPIARELVELTDL